MMKQKTIAFYIIITIILNIGYINLKTVIHVRLLNMEIVNFDRSFYIKHELQNL